MKSDYVNMIPFLGLVITLSLLAVASVYFYRRNRLSTCLFSLAVFIVGVITGMGLKAQIERAEHRRGMADKAGRLISYVTLIRDSEVEQAINALDGEINWRLKALAWGKDMKELPQYILAVWQEAKLYYEKYDVVGYDYSNDASLVRSRLKDVPWSQQEADRREFEAKYKTGTPQIAPGLDISQWIELPQSLDELRGEVVLLDIWGLWCQPCLLSLPKVQQLHEKFKDKGLTVIAVHGWGGNFEKISEFIEKNKYSFAVGVDGGKTVRDYGIVGIPAYYLIDKKGLLVRGPEHEVPSEESIAALIGEH